MKHINCGSKINCKDTVKNKQKKGENIMEKNCMNFKTKFWAWIMIFTLVLGGETYGTSISVKADITVYVTSTGSKEG